MTDAAAARSPADEPDGPQVAHTPLGWVSIGERRWWTMWSNVQWIFVVLIAGNVANISVSLARLWEVPFPVAVLASLGVLAVVLAVVTVVHHRRWRCPSPATTRRVGSPAITSPVTSTAMTPSPWSSTRRARARPCPSPVSAGWWRSPGSRGGAGRVTSASSAKPPRASRRRARHSIWCPCTSTAPTETLPRRESAGFARATTTEPAGGRPRCGRAVGESGRRFAVFSMIRSETRSFRLTSSQGLKYQFVFFRHRSY